MYQRAVEQAAIRSQLGQVSAADRGVTIHASSAAEAAGYLPDGAERSLFGTPVAGLEATVAAADLETTVAAAGQHSEFDAVVAGRDNVCTHLVLTAGRCPAGGQQVLASTSSAAVLADEPTSELDAANRARVMALLRAEAVRGAGVLVATHDPEAAAGCDAELHLSDGVLTVLRDDRSS